MYFVATVPPGNALASPHTSTTTLGELNSYVCSKPFNPTTFKESLLVLLTSAVLIQCCRRYQGLQERFRREGAATRIQACWRARVLKRNMSALVRIGKRTRAIRIQRNVRVLLAKRELQRRREANNIRYAQDTFSLVLDFRLGLADGEGRE